MKTDRITWWSLFGIAACVTLAPTSADAFAYRVSATACFTQGAEIRSDGYIKSLGGGGLGQNVFCPLQDNETHQFPDAAALNVYVQDNDTFANIPSAAACVSVYGSDVAEFCGDHTQGNTSTGWKILQPELSMWHDGPAGFPYIYLFAGDPASPSLFVGYRVEF